MSVVADRTVDCFAKQTYEIPEELQILEEENVDNFAEMLAKAKEDMDPVEYSNFYNNKFCGTFRIMSQKDGDKRVVWRRRVIAEIKAAKKMFMDLVSKGMQPYRVGVDGKATSELMKEFDPLAEEIIFMPLKAIAGG